MMRFTFFHRPATREKTVLNHGIPVQ
jgi:hypothetical protein